MMPIAVSTERNRFERIAAGGERSGWAYLTQQRPY
jgi:hypothetical protein